MTFTSMSRSASAPLLPGQSTHYDREALCITSPSFLPRGSFNNVQASAPCLSASPRYTGSALPCHGGSASLLDLSMRIALPKSTATLSFNAPPPQRRNQQNNGPGFPLRRIHSDNELRSGNRSSRMNRIMSREDFDKRNRQQHRPGPHGSGNTTDPDVPWTPELLPATLLSSGVQGFFPNAHASSLPYSLYPHLTPILSQPGRTDLGRLRLTESGVQDSRECSASLASGLDNRFFRSELRLRPGESDPARGRILDGPEAISSMPRTLQSVYQPVLRPHPEVLEALGDEFLIEGPSFYSTEYGAFQQEGPPRTSGSPAVLEGLQAGPEVTEEYYSRALRDDPENPLLLRNYARFIVQTRNDCLAAERCLERAIVASPCDADVLVQYAKLVWDFRRDSDRAVAYFERAVQSSPDDCYVLAAYASFLWSVEAAGAATPVAEGSLSGPHCPPVSCNCLRRRG